MGNIVVVTVEGRIEDVKLPLDERRLEEIRDHTGTSIIVDEERLMLEWLKGVEFGDRPIDDERLGHLLNNRGERTRIAEDQAIARWILAAWDAIKELKRL